MKFGKMKTHRRNRLLLVLFIIVSCGAALSLALMALNENINLFYEPEQITNGEAPVGELIRAGGMVKTGSIVRAQDRLQVNFLITDMRESEVEVQYVGILPDLFREGQGVIARGRLSEEGIFVAEEVLAKHDEKYMAPELKNVMENAEKPEKPKLLDQSR